ncbi:MAG: hypothetical protein DRI01_00690 [Chloroflexi bacterium]|nr:MAG: hypothetical protein DRI01_00690 [Chloroflexota bacterium]
MVEVFNINQIRQKFQQLSDIDFRSELYKISVSFIPEMIKRISKGIDKDKGKFKPYSEKPIYVSSRRPGLKSIRPLGKTGRRKFKSGKPLVCRYFPRGYRQFREYMGRRVNADRLIFTGKMLNSIYSTVYGTNSVKITFSRSEEAKKASGQHERYNFWGLTFDGRKKILGKLYKKLTQRMEELFGKQA